MIHVVVASSNPVKIGATRVGLARVFPHIEWQVEGISVPSDVSDQPMTDEETFRGACNRVKAAHAKMTQATLAVGIEGGLDFHHGTLIAFGWIVIGHKGTLYKARSSTFTLPQPVAAHIAEGMELGHAIDVHAQTENSKHRGGAVGYLTHGLITRQMLYEPPMIMALSSIPL